MSRKIFYNLFFIFGFVNNVNATARPIRKKPLSRQLLLEKQDKIAKSKEFFDGNSNITASYIYAPGLMSSELGLGRYCPDFIASTGEKVKWNNAGHVFGQPHSAVTFAEINLKKQGVFTLNPIAAIMNGVRNDLYPLIKRFMQEKCDFSLERNPDSNESIINYSISFSKANVAQEADIKILCKTYNDHVKQYPKTDVILYGDSRGAATIFNFLTLHKAKQVKAAVVEGIFDTVQHGIKHFIYSDKNPESESCLHNIFSFMMRSYKKNGPFPIDYAQKINDDIPLLIVTCLKDGLTPAQGAFNLYAILKKMGHKKVHLLVLQKALHPCYMMHNKEDKDLYENVVHAFYKHYNLPYNSSRALLGQKDFLSTQPSVESLKEYDLDYCQMCTY